MHRLIKCLSAVLLMLLLTAVSAAALAELGHVVTPGGPVKMRKKASAKSGLVTQVPNNSLVEVDEVGEEWCHITYRGKSGYIMREYIVTADDLNDSALVLTMTPETPSVGGVIDFQAACDGAVEYQYTLVIGSGKSIGGTKVPYDVVSFRPRKAGTACLEVTAWYPDGTSVTNQRYFEIADEDVSAGLENPAAGFVLYSQKDGWWLGKKYRTSTLDKSGCAIFTLAHALQLMGFTGAKDCPEQLAVDYAFCLVDGGTLNSTLIGRAAKNYGFSTKPDLINSAPEITSRLQDGDLFTFAIVSGHIALACGLSEDGTKVKIIDSAPATTLERIKNGSLYVQESDGTWREIHDIAEIPGAKYYFETDCFGGLTYYLDLKYVAKRGVRLIRPAK